MGKGEVEVPTVPAQGVRKNAGADVAIEGFKAWKLEDAELDKIAAVVGVDKADMEIYTAGTGAEQKLYVKNTEGGHTDENKIFEFTGNFTDGAANSTIDGVALGEEVTGLNLEIFNTGASTLSVTQATIKDGLTSITNDNGDNVDLTEEQMNEIASLFGAGSTAAGLQMEIFSQGDEHYAVDKDGNIKKFSLDNTDSNKVVEDTATISAKDQNKILQSWSVTGTPDYPDAVDGLLAKLDDAMTQVTNFTADLGAIQNRFGSIIANLNTTVINTSEARSRVLDADFSVEVSAMSRANILQQAGVSVLAQANQVPQNVLSLLR